MEYFTSVSVFRIGDKKMTLRRVFYWVCCCACVIGVGLRFFSLRESGFFFYDEAFYFHHNLPILEFINNNAPQTWADRWTAFQLYLHSALASGKSLWFLAMDSRFLWGGLHDWMFSKVLAACFGILAVPLAYLFARKYYGVRDVALFSAALMAILPGMVFYSRIGLQEAMSTCLVVGGMYLYLFHRGLGWKTFLSGVVLAAAFFANYRLIILPVIVLCIELWDGVVLRKGVDLRKFVWFLLTFFACVILVGNLMGAVNTKIIFAWVFHQEDMVKGSFSWVNLLSYPFYLFLLETFLFAGAFFASGVYFSKNEWRYSLPFVLVVTQMLIFSLPSEKGARYLCVMLPFAVMSVAYVGISLFRSLNKVHRQILVGSVGLMMFMMLDKSIQIVQAKSDYEPAVAYIEKHVPGAKILSTQEQVQQLYVRPYKRVKPVPGRFDRLGPLYADGYRYLVIDPQVYVGLTSGVRFKTDLRDYLAFIDSHMTPVKVFPHMNHAMLERFVCEHSENLVQSIRFLYSKDIARMSSIRIYDMNGVVPVMSEMYLKLLKERK